MSIETEIAESIDTCAKCGEPMADHSIRHPGHKGIVAPRGGKALCPHGAYEHTHNVKDKYQLVQFWCIWSQVFDGEADKTLVTVDNLNRIIAWLYEGSPGTRLAGRTWAPDKAPKLASSPTKSYGVRVLGEAKPKKETAPAPAPYVAPAPVAAPTPVSSIADAFEAMERRKAEAEAPAPEDAKAARKAKAKKALSGLGTMR